MRQELENSKVGAAFGREMELLICLARVSLSSRDRERIQTLLRAGISWELFSRLALLHRLFPLVTKHLGFLVEEGGKEEVLQRFRQMMRQHVIKSMVFANYVNRLVTLLQQQGITLVPFKGPVAAQQLFGDYALRMYGDLDLLVDRDHVARVWDQLKIIGYEPEFEINQRSLPAYTAIEDSITFTSKDKPTLELHWELSERSLRRPFDLGSIEEGLTAISFEGVQVPAMSAEDLLLYYCIHGCKHNWEQYELVVCVGRHIEMNQIQWEIVAAKATRLGCVRALRIGLGLAQKLYGTVIPRLAVDLIGEDRRADSLVEAVCEQLGDMEGAKRFRDPRFRLFRLRIKDSNLDAFAYVLRLIFAPSKSEWRALPLANSRLVFIYWIIRPFRVLIAGLNGIISWSWSR